MGGEIMNMILRLAGDVNYGDGMGSLIVVIGGLLAAVLMIAVVMPISRAFIQEKQYVENKILSSRTDAERIYWEKRKKSLMLSLLPFHHYDRHVEKKNHKDED